MLNKTYVIVHLQTQLWICKLSAAFIKQQFILKNPKNIVLSENVFYHSTVTENENINYI